MFVITSVPAMPQGLTICETTGTYITLSWEPPAEDGGTPVTGYEVICCNISDNEWIKGQVLEDDITLWRQENLVKGKEYIFQVTAKNKMGESDPVVSENPVMLLRKFSVLRNINAAETQRKTIFLTVYRVLQALLCPVTIVSGI